MNQTIEIQSSPQKTFLLGIFLFSIFLLLYSPILPGMYSVWMFNTNNSHGILVPLISLYLIFDKRKWLHLNDIETSPWGLALLVMSLLLYIVGIIGSVEILPRLTIVTTLMGLALYHLGRKIFAVLFFPLLFLFFMVPVPDSLIGVVAFPLQLLATKLSAQIINSLSIPVYREGNMLYFANASLEVAEACSGIRSLMSYLMLGTLFAYMVHGRFYKRILLVAVAIPLAFFANLLRVTGTGILAHFYGSSVARGFLHEFSGIVMFIFGFILLFLLYTVLDKRNSSSTRHKG